MFSLVELYPQITEDYAEIPEVQEGLLRIAWNHCVGEGIRKVTEPVSYRNGVLRVRVSSPQWQSILLSMKPEIITKVNRYLKKPLLIDIHIGTR